MKYLYNKILEEIKIEKNSLRASNLILKSAIEKRKKRNYEISLINSKIFLNFDGTDLNELTNLLKDKKYSNDITKERIRYTMCKIRLTKINLKYYNRLLSKLLTLDSSDVSSMNNEFRAYVIRNKQIKRNIDSLNMRQFNQICKTIKINLF